MKSFESRKSMDTQTFENIQDRKELSSVRRLDQITKNEALEAFEYRYPIAGETIRVLVDLYGGIDPFLRSFEETGHGRELQGWITARKEVPMRLSHLRTLIPTEKLTEVSRITEHSLETIERQCTQYLPRFFSTLRENEEGLGFLWDHHPPHGGPDVFPR